MAELRDVGRHGMNARVVGNRFLRAVPALALVAVGGGILVPTATGAEPRSARTAEAPSATASAKRKAAPRARIASKRVTLGSDGRVRIKLRCSAKRPKCRGRLYVQASKTRVKTSKKGKRTRVRATYGRAKLSLRDRKTRSVRVRLSSSARGTVARRGKLSVRVLARTSAKHRRTRSATRTVTVVRGPGSTGPGGPNGANGPHRIKATATRLYDSVTGQTFRPRGANYTRLRATSNGAVYHSTFEPGAYDVKRVRAALDQMRHDGYNAVRVFIDPGGGPPGEPHGLGRGTGTSDVAYGPYMDNVASFVSLAAERGIYVVPSLDVFPSNDYYWGIVGRTNGPGGTPNIAGRNLSYMSAGHAAAKAEYMKQFTAALIARVGRERSAAVFAYQSDNETYFESNYPPYSAKTGTVKPLNGVTYDMSSPTARQQAADASLVEYTHRIKRGLAASDPDALMAIGFFTNLAVEKPGGFNGMPDICPGCPNSNKWRYPGRPSSVSIHGAADLIDLHLYPSAATWNTATDLSSMEFDKFKKPYMIGEFGAFKRVYGEPTNAARGMRDVQVATCRYGAQGWLYWTWDTHEDLAGMPLFVHMDDANGAVNGMLAPIKRPDPCKP